MVHNNLSDQLQDALLTPGPRYFEKSIGYGCVLIATALAAFDIVLLLTLIRGKGNPMGLGALMACTAILLYFFATVGRRLILNRPNTFGSIATPTVWLACFAVFGALTLLFITLAIAKRDLGLAQGATMSALLALLAFGAASHFRRRKHGIH